MRFNKSLSRFSHSSSGLDLTPVSAAELKRPEIPDRIFFAAARRYPQPVSCSSYQSTNARPVDWPCERLIVDFIH